MMRPPLPPAFDPSPLDAILPALDPGREFAFRPGLPEAFVEDLPSDLQTLYRWHDGQDPSPDRLLVRARSGIMRRLRPQGRLLTLAEARARARPGFFPVFEATDESEVVGRAADGTLRQSSGRRAERGSGDLAAWAASLVRAHRAAYLVDADPVTRAQRWVLGVPGALGEDWGAATDTFGMVLCPEHSWEVTLALRDDWGIDSAASATGVLATLQARSKAASPAWNLARLVAIAGWSYRAGLLPLDVAWHEAVAAARALQNCHKGWFSMAEAYFVGRDKELGVVYDLEARQAALTGLHQDPWSLWNLLPWKTPLPDDLPPPPEPETSDVFHVTTSDELARALTEAPPRSVIHVAPGRYVGAFTLAGAGMRLEVAPEAAAGSVVLEASGPAPVLTIDGDGGKRIAGLAIVASPEGAGILLNASFAEVERCVFDRGVVAIDVAPPASNAPSPIVHLERTTFSRAQNAVHLPAGWLRGRDLDVLDTGGDAFVIGPNARGADFSRVQIDGPGGSGIVAAGEATLVLSEVIIQRAGAHGLSLSGGRARLDACDIRGSGENALCAFAGAEVTALRSRFADAGGENVKLIATKKALLEFCHITGGSAGVVLHRASGTELRGGQVGGCEGVCVTVYAGNDIVLDAVALGPTKSAPGLTLDDGAEVRVFDATCSGIGGPGVVVGRGRLELNRLRVRKTAGPGVVVRDARLDARRLECMDIGGDGVVLERLATARIIGLAVHEAERGLVVGGGAVGLVHELIVSQTRSAIVVGEGARVAVAGGVALGDARPGAIVVSGRALLALQGLALGGRAEHAILVEDAHLHLDGGALTGTGALRIAGGRAVLARVFLSEGRASIVEGGPAEVVLEPHPPTMVASSPLFWPLQPERFLAWAMPGDVVALNRVATRVAELLGVVGRLAFRETPGGLRIEGPQTAIARLAPALMALFDEAGALGLALADLREGP